MSHTDEVLKLKNHITEIYELIAGDNAINRFTPDEMIDYIKALNEQIAEWRKRRLDGSSPEARAQSAEYRRAMRVRREQLGIEEGPGRGRGRG